MIIFEKFVTPIVQRNEDHLCNDGAEVQIKRAVQQMEHFASTTPLWPVTGKMVSLANFGETPIYFAAADDEYVLLSEAAGSLGMAPWEAHQWGQDQFAWAVQEQREMDEQRGDGRLGYECMRDYLDLRLDLVMDNPGAKPDAGGRRWSSAGDWLVSTDRLMVLILDSPWRDEFMANTGDLMRHAFRGSFGDLPGFPEPELSEEEAQRRARRGPSLEE